MTDRKIKWLSSLDVNNVEEICLLEKKLAAFYLSNTNYYNDIDFTAGNWNNEYEPGYIDILNTAKKASKILEVGCGSSNILKFTPKLQNNYFGCDFSIDLITSNIRKYPGADFRSFTTPNLLPYDNLMFDLVFSVFVLEHSTNPALLLTECVRTLKKGGILIILCPDFLSCGRMTSQRAGFSEGTSRSKLQKKKYFDALVTFYDNRIRIPLYCKYLKKKMQNSPKFFINADPTVFSDCFIPDIDAVYVTYRTEIIKYLSRLELVKNTQEIENYEHSRKIIYLKFIKKI